MEEEPKTQATRTEQRGRKRNDALPPSRAREVQRAFRARRAAHLAALEERVKEVETENAELRELLHMPPANRPAIRSGPTGRGKVIDTPGSSSALKMDSGDYSGSESGSDSRGGTPGGEDGSKASGSRKRHASSQLGSRPASGDFTPSMSQLNSMFDPSRVNGIGGASRLPYGFNAFPNGVFPQAGLGNGQFPIAGLLNNSPFPNLGAGSPRPEEVLQFQQQLHAHQQQQLAAFGSNGNGNGLSSTGMYPSSLMNLPGSPSSSNSPYASNFQQQLAASQQAFQLMQAQQQQQPERPHSSNSHHGDSHSSFSQQHRQPSSQHSSPLANGFPPYPGQQVSTPGSMSSSFNPPSRSGTPNFQQSRPAGTPSGRIEIGSAQAYSVMDRLKACCKLDDQAVSSDPGLLAFCNDIVTSLGAQPSDCLLPPSPAPPTPSPTASPASHPSTPNPSSVLSAANKSGSYLTIFNVWLILRQSYPLPAEAAVRDAMEAGSRAAKALLKAANSTSVKVEGWAKSSKGSYGEKIVCRNTNGVEVERHFLESYMASLVDGGARKQQQQQQQVVGNGNGTGGAVLGSWGEGGAGLKTEGQDGLSPNLLGNGGGGD